MRIDQPSAPIDKQLWYNQSSGNLSVYVGGLEKVLNLRVVTIDPFPVTEGEAWINHTTSTLKYVYLGVVRSISIGAGIQTPDGSQNTGGYLKTLGEAELKTISDISLNYPNYMIDAFNDVKTSATYTNVSVSGSRLKIAAGTDGSYKRDDHVSNPVNYVDGVVVSSVQALKPKLITNIGGGFHTIEFYKDVTGIMGVGKKIMGYERYSFDGLVKNLYMLDPVTQKPISWPITAATYNATTRVSTITVQTSGFDITLGKTFLDIQEYLRFFQFGLTVKADGNGGTGLVDVPLEEAYTSDARRILGEDAIQNIEKTYSGAVNELVAQCSANKTYWIILAKVKRLGTLGDDVVFWYSTDGLRTILQATNFTSPCAPFAETTASANDFANPDFQNGLNRNLIQISDDGRFIFGHKYLSSASWLKLKGYFGKLTGTTADIRLFPKSHDLDGEISIGARNEYDHVLAMDWENNCLAAATVYSSPTPTMDPYILFYTFNWTSLLCNYLNYVFPGGASYSASNYPIVMFWKTFESERMLFWTQTHNNGNLYAFKVRQYNVLTLAAGAINISASSATGPTGTWPTLMNAFTSSTVAGTRSERADWTQQVGATHKTLAWCWNFAGDELLLLKADDQTNIYLCTLHFGRTTAGTFSQFEYSMFPTVPTSGTYTISVTNVRTAVTNTTTALAYNADAVAIKAALEALAVVGAGNATVTGVYNSGVIAVTLAVRDPLNVTFPADTLLTSGVATDAMLGAYTLGTSPVWLTFPPTTNVTTVYTYSNLGSMIVLDANTGPLFSYNDSNISTMLGGKNVLFQRMLAGANNEVYITGDWAPTDNDVDQPKTIFIKIPNYKDMRGHHYVSNTGTQVNLSYGDASISALYGKKFATKYTVPTAANYPVAGNYAYSDGNVHIRSIALFMTNSYNSQKCYNPAHRFKITVTTVGGTGGPSSVVLAQSVSVPVINMTPYDDFKWYQFPLLTELRLAPGAQVFIILEANFDTMDAAEMNPTGQGTAWRGIPQLAGAAGTGGWRINASGLWESIANVFWFRLYDMFYGRMADFQANPYYQGPSQLNNVVTNEDSESTMAFISNSNTVIRHTYRNSDAMVTVNSNAYSGDGAHAKSFVGEIYDTNGQYTLPTFTAPRMLGDKGTTSPYLMFGVNFGDESSRFINPRTGKVETLGDTGNLFLHEGYGYRAYGGISQFSATDNNIYSLISRTGLTYGIKEDSDFLSGKCLSIANGGFIQYKFGTYGLFPGPKDFCIEFEYKPGSNEFLTSGNQRMIIDMEGFIRVQSMNGKYSFFLWGNPTETWEFRAAESFVAGHQIIRVGRTFAGGAFIKVSYNKGVTWNTLTLSGSSNPSVVSGGRVIGLQTTGYDTIRFGGYSQAAGYEANGCYGYVKFLNGVSEPTFPGLINMDEALDFRRVMNFGDQIFAMRVTGNTYGSIVSNQAQAALMYPDPNTPFVSTRDQIFRYKAAIPQGRVPSLKLELKRQSSADPMSLQGYLVNFERK